MEMSCTVLTRNEIRGIITGEIPQAFNPLCRNGKETRWWAILKHNTRLSSHAPHWVKMKPKQGKNKIFFFNLNCHSVQGRTMIFFLISTFSYCPLHIYWKVFLCGLLAFSVIFYAVPQLFKGPQNTAIIPDSRSHHCKKSEDMWITKVEWLLLPKPYIFLFFLIVWSKHES